jgi:hypothetical protein
VATGITNNNNNNNKDGIREIYAVGKLAVGVPSRTLHRMTCSIHRSEIKYALMIKLL